MNHPEPIHVKLDADHVLSPIVRYGDPCTAIFFPVEPTEGSEVTLFGRVTFEGFDSIRCSRGEYFPYGGDGGYNWVCEILESTWLNERHDYEYKFYKTPLLEDYHHYVFSFHDQFVEAIAKGIWIEETGTEMSDELTEDHPLSDLPTSLPAEAFVLHRLSYELRRNPRPPEEIVKDSMLCSQKLFQFYLTLDGSRKPGYAAELRTVQGRSVTRLQAGWPYRVLETVNGVADVEDMMPAWEQYVSQVAERRKELGKKD